MKRKKDASREGLREMESDAVLQRERKLSNRQKSDPPEKGLRKGKGRK